MGRKKSIEMQCIDIIVYGSHSYANDWKNMNVWTPESSYIVAPYLEDVIPISICVCL